jgi:large subunit ribosomal protein L13
MPFKTYAPKAKDIQEKWYLVDAKDLVVGRLSAAVARIIRAKNDPGLSLHMDHGVNMVIVNAEKVHFTGRKDKPFYRHTGHPGGIVKTLPSQELQGRFPERVLERSIKRMLGKAGPLRASRMKNVRIYKGEHHPHQAQQPITLDIGAWNEKNKKRSRQEW